MQRVPHLPICNGANQKGCHSIVLSGFLGDTEYVTTALHFRPELRMLKKPAYEHANLCDLRVLNRITDDTKSIRYGKFAPEIGFVYR